MIDLRIPPSSSSRVTAVPMPRVIHEVRMSSEGLRNQILQGSPPTSGLVVGERVSVPLSCPPEASTADSGFGVGSAGSQQVRPHQHGATLPQAAAAAMVATRPAAAPCPQTLSSSSPAKRPLGFSSGEPEGTRDRSVGSQSRSKPSFATVPEHPPPVAAGKAESFSPPQVPPSRSWLACCFGGQKHSLSDN